MNEFDKTLESQEANPLDNQELNITNEETLNQVVEQPDLSVSNTEANQILEGEDPTPRRKLVSGINATAKLLTPKTKTKRNPLLEAASIGGVSSSDAGIQLPGTGNYDAYAKYLPSSEAGIATPVDLWDKERALRQTNWDQASNAGLRILGNIIPEILQQGSRMLDFSGDYSSDNAVGQAMQKWKDSVNEATPIYRENPTQSFDVGDFAYWMENGSNLVTSAAAFAVLGYATGGVGGAALRGLGMGARTLAGARTGAAIGQYLETGGNALVNAYMLNKAESVGVAIDTYKETYEKSLQELRDNNGTAKKTDAQLDVEARKKAADAASYAYNINKINIALNLTSAFKFVKPFARGARLNITTDGIFNNAMNVAERTAKQSLIHGALDVAKEGAQEYAEETINYIAQRRAVEGDYNKSFKEVFNNSLADAGSEQGIEAGFWGFLGGVAQTGLTKVGSYIPMHKNTAYNEAYNNAISKYQREVDEGRASYTNEEIVQKAQTDATQKTGNPNRLVSNNYIKNYRDNTVREARREILSRFAPSGNEDDQSSSNGESNIFTTSNIFNNIQDTLDLYDEQEAALINGDSTRASELDSIIFANQVQQAIKTGTLNTLEDSLKAIRNLTPEEALSQGFAKQEGDNEYKTKINKALETIKTMETNSIINERYINNEDVDNVDKDLLIQGERAEINDKRFKDYRRKQFIDRNDLYRTTPHLTTSYEDYVNLSKNERAEQYTPSQIKDISRSVKETEESIEREFNKPSQKELNSDPTLNMLWKAKEHSDNIMTALQEVKSYLTSPETQQKVRQIKIDTEEQASIYRSQLREANQKAKAEAKAESRKQKQQAKNSNDAGTQNQTATTVSTPNIQAQSQPIQTSTQVVEEEDGSISIIPENVQVVTPSIAISDNLALTELTEKANINEITDTPFIDQYKKVISNLLEAIKERNPKIDQSWFNQKIESLNSLIIDTKEKEKVLFDTFSDIRKLDEKGINIVPVVNRFFANEVDRFTRIRDAYNNMSALITDMNQQQRIEELEPESTETTNEESLNSFDDDFSEGEIFDLDREVERQQKQLNFKDPLRTASTVLELINSLADQGISINNFTDLYNQFVNASTKSMVDNILPKLKNIWNYIVRDNQLSGVEVDVDDFTIDTISTDVSNVIADQIVRNVWSDNNDEVLVDQIKDIVNNINYSMIGNRPVLSTSGTGAKSITPFNIAWNAREYIGRLNSVDSIYTETKEDANNDLNENSSYELFDDSTLPIGTELTLIPLGLNKDHSYYDFKTGNKITYRRTTVDIVEKTTFNNNNLIKKEELNAIEHLPIFISKSSKDKDIIEGAFLHTADWINSNNLVGDEQEVEQQKQQLLSLRRQIVDNLTKTGTNKRLVKVAINDKSLGIPITTQSESAKTLSRLTENLTLGIVVDDNIKVKPNEVANYKNKLSVASIPNGTTFVMLPSNKDMIAYPLRKVKLADIENNNIKDSISGVLDLFFTPISDMSPEQRKNATKFKELGIDTNNFESVKGYLNNFLFTNVLAKRLGDDKQSFDKFIKTNNRTYNDLSIFRFTKDGNNIPYLQFGRVGTSTSEINPQNYKENKDALLNVLGNVLNNSYINSSLFNLNSNKKIIGLVNGEVQTLYNNYNDMIKDVTITSLDPKTIYNPKTGKPKTIYTFQKTFELSEPINIKKPSTVQINESVTAPVEEVQVNESIEEDSVDNELLNNLLNMDDDMLFGTFENLPDKGNVVYFDEIAKKINQVGTQEEYKQYINTIFPDSMIKDVVYHGGEVNKFDAREEGIFFTRNKSYAEKYGRPIAVKLNITNGARLDTVSKTLIGVDFKEDLQGYDGVIGEEAFGIVNRNGQNFAAEGEAIAVFNPSQIHILGSNEDIEGFRRWKQEDSFNTFDTNDSALDNIADNYTYIKGINSTIQNSIINNIKNTITQQIVTTKKPITISEAIDRVMTTIRNNRDAVQSAYDKNLQKLTEQQKNTLVTRLQLIQEKIDLLENNRNKLQRRVRLSIKQEGIANELRGTERQQFIAETKATAESLELQQEDIELGIREGLPVLDDFSVSGENQELPESITEFTDEENENSYDSDAIGINPVSSLSKEVKSFFDGIREITYKDGKFVPVTNYLGLNNYVPFNTVYQKVQELLALFPNKQKINPTFEEYVSTLEQYQEQVPYLKDVVDKLKGSEVSTKFKNQFVNSLYKMYHNTVFLQTKYNNKDKGYNSYLINTDTSNYVRLLKDEWKNNFELSNNYEVINIETENPSKIIKEQVKDRITEQYNSMTTNRVPITIESLNNFFANFGIELPVLMTANLVNGNFVFNNTKYTANSFMKQPMINYMVSSVIGKVSEGSEGITDLLTQDMYADASFTVLANMISLYKDNLTSNSSRNINGDMNFNFGEVKNLVDTFDKVKNNLNFMVASLSDPYRLLTPEADRTSKRYNTWLEQLFAGEGDTLRYNIASNFYQSFKYFTYTGGKVRTPNGTIVNEVDKYSEIGYTKAKLNLFLNQANTIGSGANLAHVANYMYFTMSDKKVPVGFSAPSVGFNLDTILKPLEENQDVKKAEDQINYLYDTLVKPDVQRMLYLSNKEAADEINIKGYDLKNSRFFTLPILNLIDFDYVDGDINNDKDTGALRERLGLDKSENLFNVYGEGKSIKKEINPLVLQKPEVQAFIKEKLRQVLRDKYIETINDLINIGVLTTTEVSGQKVPSFVKGTDLDITSIKKLYGEGPRGIANFVMNYMLNTTTALAQFQQLLVGDPIQFFKDSKTSNSIRKDLGKNLRKKAVLNHRIQIGKITEESGINELQNLSKEHFDLLDRYRRSWGLLDVLETNNNQGKRLAGDNASGSKMVYSKDNASYNLLVLDDVEVSSKLRNFYYETLVPDYIKELPERTLTEQRAKKEAIDNLLSKYDNINQADAQELTTLKEHVDTMVMLGELDEQDAQRILKDDREGKLNIKDYNNVLQPMKLVYSNNYIRDGINSRLYVKSSSFPLSKTFTKGLPIDSLRLYMEDNNIQRTAFKSAVKVGQPKGIAGLQSIFNPDNTISIKDLSALESTVIRGIPRDGHKKQQNVPYDENKHQINDGTQKAKLLFLNLMDTKGFINPVTKNEQTGRELYKGYREVYREYYKIQYNNLINELYPENLNGQLDYNKLRSIIVEESESRGLSENDLSYFNLNEDGTNFEFPLWLSGNEGKLTSLLNAIVDNRIRKRKREGKSAVLLSDIVLSTDPKYQSNIIYTTNDRPSELRSMRDENGKIQYAEVIMPFYFRDNKGNKLKLKNFVNDQGIIDQTKLPDNVLDTIGFRIPTQGLNSMDAIKVIGFLPEGYENTVIAPRDFITQMGSDFDVDKLFQDMVNTIYEDGSIRKVDRSDYNNYKSFKEYKRKLKAVKNLKRRANDPSESPDRKEGFLTRVSIIGNELNKMRGDLTPQQYIDQMRNMPRDLELKYLENMMLDFNKAVLMNPSKDVQKQRTQPIDSKVFVEITEDIVNKIYAENVNDNWTPYSDNFQTKKYVAARGGKSGVSTYSSTSVLNTIMQTVDYNTNPMNFQYKVDDKYVPNTYNVFGTKSNELNNPISSNGEYKSDIIQALQSISVDNENLQMMHKLNMNDYTADFIRASSLLGFTAKDIFYLINHPVVKEVVRAKQADDRMKTPKYYKEELIDGQGVKRTPYTSAEIKEALRNLTHSEVLADITDNHLDIDSLTHFAIYNIYEELSQKGKTLKSIEGLMNVDSKGLGSNLFYTLEKENAILNLRTNKEISNVSGLLGRFEPDFENSRTGQNLVKYDEDGKLTNEYIEGYKEYENKLIANNFIKLKDYWFRPNNIPSMATVYALVTNNKLWSKQFPYHTPVIDSVTEIGLDLENNKKSDKFYTITGTTPADNIGFANKQVNKDSIATTSPQRDSEVKQRVLSEFKSFLFTSVGNENAVDARKRLFLEQNVADILNHVKRNNLLPYNTFIKRLSIVNENPETIIPLNNVVYNASSRETVEENGVVNDILSLLQDNNTFEYNGQTYKYSDLGAMLVSHQMLTGGIQKAKQFVKHIPPYYLKAIGLYNNIDNIINGTDFSKTAQFAEQYLQHYPEYVSSLQLQEDINSGLMQNKDGILTLPELLLSNEDLQSFNKNYISYMDSNGKYNLFKRSINDPYKFIQIPILGKHGIKEYNVNTSYGNVTESIFEENNPIAKWYNNEHLIEQIINKGLSEDYIGSVIKNKLELGKTNMNDEEAIVKICK